MKTFLIAGNWKMNTNIIEARLLVDKVISFMNGKKLLTEVLVCPPFVNLESVKNLIQSSSLKIGAQNCYYKKNGAFTGEISIDMLLHIGIEYIIIGHSERRKIFLETDELINLKLKAILESKLKPILCIGETLEERQNNLTFDILKNQIKKAYLDIDSQYYKDIIIAYEPVWAIGTGVSATKEQAEEVHSKIREFLNESYGENASHIRILYGGSLNDKNASELLLMPNIDGGLIGGAALIADAFIHIIETAELISHN